MLTFLNALYFHSDMPKVASLKIPYDLHEMMARVAETCEVDPIKYIRKG